MGGLDPVKNVYIHEQMFVRYSEHTPQFVRWIRYAYKSSMGNMNHLLL